MDDIRQVVEALERSAALLPVGVVVTDPNGSCVFTGGSWSRLSGITAEANAGDGWAGANDISTWRSLPEPRPALSLEYKSSSEDGLVGWSRGSLEAVVGEDGAVIAYAGSIHDVTECARREARLRQLAEDPSNAIVRLDRTGKITYVSPIFRILGDPGLDPTGLQMASYIHPDDLHQFADRDSLFENPDEIRHRRFRILTRGGEIMWFDARSHAVVDPITGQVNEIQSSLSDVTAEVEAEQALRESEERFRVLADAAAEGVSISEAGAIVSTNAAFGELYGYSSAEVSGMPISAFMSAKHHEAAMHAHSYEGAVSVEFTAVRKDGSTFPAFASSRTATYQGRSVRVTAITDLTALKLSLALEERRRIARDLHDGLAHELAFIAGKARTARRIPPSPDVLADVASAADRALFEARRAISVLSSSAPAPLPVAIAQTAEDLCSRADLALALHVDESIRVDVDAEENLLRILREAVTNADRHGHAEKVSVRLWRDDQVHLTIDDDGVGFDQSLQMRGFGLVSMKERAAAIGATLTIFSRVGDGTRVEVSVPCAS
ncbi:MAG TPA: PAS domain S-box protein [Acidimicrobiales bacterium]|nr:PAS domain S-box protein [Acidimicrobiales bacterium]